MRLLLDTNVILWLLTDDPRLSNDARRLLAIPGRDVYYSVVSLWEIGIKFGLGRLELPPLTVGAAMRNDGYNRLPINDEHIERIANLPKLHRDPFDRMLVAQAESEPLKLVTSDRHLLAYGPSVILV